MITPRLTHSSGDGFERDWTIPAEELRKREIRLQIVEARSSVRDRLRAEGLDEKIGGINRFRGVAQVIEEFEAGVTKGDHSSTLSEMSFKQRRL